MKRCPRCKTIVIATKKRRNFALSRRDNKTMICPPCGQLEALEDAKIILPYEGKRYWKVEVDNG